ncbi:MAG: glycosyltransferase family 2 protein [Candidatus Hydrogenedentes bacterium]|nr:glycosyltransferase family 2 protein [Candidatus Hydrogenedentota bacterium]
MACIETDVEKKSLLKNVVVVIPCFNAGHRVQGAVESVLAQVEYAIVVDDGSTDGCIDALAEMPVQLLSFPENQGKGYALIAGVRAALELQDITAIVLMDADGQHDAAELPGLFACFNSEGADLVIGARSFDRKQVPWRSRFGNRMTAWVMGYLCGRYLPDTQCGFRILSPRFARCFVEKVPGGRYETEIRMLLMAIHNNFHIVSSSIATLYEPGNPSSHFRKIQDSFRIYRALLQNIRLFRRL